MIRPCQINFLFSVTRAHAKKRGVLKLFIQKLARVSFLFIASEKKITFHIFQFQKITKRHQRISFKQRALNNSLVSLQFFSFSFWINNNELDSGVESLILPFRLKRLLRCVCNEIIRALLECTSEISFGD